MLLEHDDGLNRSTELSTVKEIVFLNFGHLWSFAVFHSYEYRRALSKVDEAIELLAFYRVIALLRTDRDHDQKLVRTRLFALLPGRGKSHMGFWTFSKYPLYLSSILLAQALCIEAPESMTNIRSSVSLAPSQENKT